MLRAFVALSAVERDSAEAFMKVVLSLVMSRDFGYNAIYRRKTTEWLQDAQPFIKRFKFRTASLKKAHKFLLANADPSEDSKYDDAITKVVLELKEKEPAMKKELDLRREDITLLKDLRLVYTKDSEAALRRLSRAASRFMDSDISAMFVEDHEDTTEEVSELEELVKKYTGKPGRALPTEITSNWTKLAKKRGEKVEDHKRYLALRKALRESFKTRLQAIVRTSGEHILPLHDVISQLESEGIAHTLPHGFVGMVDDEGKLYTTAGLKMWQSPSGDVQMNPAYIAKEDNAYVCRFLAEGAKDYARGYTEAYRAAAKKSKFGVVSETMPKLNALAKKWRADMRDLDSKEGVLANLAEFIFVTSARVSNANATSKGSRTYGATQIELRHVKMDDHKITVTYQGKSAGKQTHIIDYTKSPSLKLLGKNMKKLMKGKSSTDPVFTYRGKPMTGTAIGRYMKSIGFPDGFTVHKLRTARGTKMASDLLKSAPFKKSGDWTEREVNQWVESELLKIGKELGHMSGEKYTANTAINNYIEPDILGDFYGKLGIRPPAKIQKAIDSVNKSG